ncbi:MAG: RNA 2',3'-cyclic phosphodiesterase [Candidatus Omnitrophica bacterium]|nr:RNA 2',3'-cyclic phosphodiesterase [Candidatus Omnitrophota bacterium]
MRCFIAVEPPEETRKEISRLQAELKQSGADVKWVEPGNIHLTLKFLGEIDEASIASLKEALSSTLRFSPFTMTLEGIGAFPGTTNPRVIWVGVHQGEKESKELAADVDGICEKLGFPKEERPFSPHLTIGRVRSRDRMAPLIKRLQVAEFRCAQPVAVDRIVLFQSVLSPKGPCYTPLAEISLR